MISETRFAKSYSSVWRDLTPTLEFFVRKANIRLADRFWIPLNSIADPRKRALINQIAFRALEVGQGEAASQSDRSEWLTRAENLRRCEIDVAGEILLGDSELSEVSELARRMQVNLFNHQPRPVALKPFYPGCGFINSCYGDAISTNNRIIELKDGDRPFRSYDFQQIIVYAALHMNAGNGLAPDFSLINSRRGTEVTIDLNEFANEVAGQSPVDLLSEVIRVISDPTVTISS